MADYFFALSRNEKKEPDEDLPPITRSLQGVLANSSVKESDYKKYLEKISLNRNSSQNH